MVGKLELVCFILHYTLHSVLCTPYSVVCVLYSYSVVLTLLRRYLSLSHSANSVLCHSVTLSNLTP